MRVGGKTSVGRHRTLRTLVAASLAAALGACSGVSIKNDPEAERIVKKVMQAEEEDPTGLPLGGKDITGGIDMTAVAKVRASVSSGGERQDATVDIAWRTDADNELGVFTCKGDMGDGRTLDFSLYVQQANGVYVVHRQLDGEWVRKSYRRNELVDALEDETMSPKTTDLLEDVKGLTHAKSGNTHVITGILDMNLSDFSKKDNLTFKVNKNYSRFTMTVNEKDYLLESFKGNVIGTVREGAARGKMKMDIDIKVDKSTSARLSLPEEAKNAPEGDPFDDGSEPADDPSDYEPDTTDTPSDYEPETTDDPADGGSEPAKDPVDDTENA